jgi:DNA-binding PadR family transcriptional regulator
MSLEQRAQVLESVASNPCGVRELIQRLNWKASRVVSLLKRMETERLIELKQVASSRRGRPKKQVAFTSLGIEFLEDYKRLKMKPIRARKEDLQRAVKDALYAERLVAKGHSPFSLFMELNTIARNIKVASETRQTA